MSDRAPDVFGEIVGWRAWQVIGNERFPMLSSVTYATCIWHPAHWTHALCQGELTCRYSDGIPGERCTCGLYAARDRQHLVALGYNRDSHAIKPVFIGQVGLAGKVIPGTQGWRAEKARIVKLYVPHRHWHYVGHLERLYKVPVVLDNTYNVAPSMGAGG